MERRINVIESDQDIGLIERPEFKRRWESEPLDVGQQRALRLWLLDRLEEPHYWDPLDPTLFSCARLADRARADKAFLEAAELYGPDRDIGRLVQELMLREYVPAVASQRYADSGMRIRAEWERTWRLQRLEDAIDRLAALPESDARHLSAEQAVERKASAVGVIPVPARYTQKDFRTPTYWNLRGKLDVQEERFILYPGAELGNDRTPVIGWAGWDHLQRARALAQRIIALRDDSADLDRLVPLLAGLFEVLPWVHQWHPEPDPALGGQTAGAAFDALLNSQLDELHLTLSDLKVHTPLP